MSYRKQVWEKTLIKIEKHNAELLEGKHTYGMGLNQFSDLTPEEFKMIYLTPKFDDPKPVRQVFVSYSDRHHYESIKKPLASVQTGLCQLLRLTRKKIGEKDNILL